MITEEVKKIIEENAVAFATVGKDGNPHCVAVGDARVVSKNGILIGSIFLKETVKNIKNNNNVSLAVWNKDWERECIGYELKGKAEYFSSGKWLEKVKQIHKGFSPKGAILITISKIKKLA